MTVLRSSIFNVAFIAWTAFIVILFLPLMPFSRPVAVKVQYWWSAGTLTLLRWIVGIRHQVEGLEHLPKGPVLVAGNHQSAWETIAMYALMDDPAYVLKRELMWIPVFGWYGWRTGQIPIDRSAGSKALRSMLRAADRAVKGGRAVIIFPEGTRVAPNVKAPYQPGVAGLYRHLGLPVVPAAVNSGLYWGRNAFLKRPGTIRLKFLPAIPPGLDRKEFMATLEGRVAAAAKDLMAHPAEAAKAPSDTPL